MKTAKCRIRAAALCVLLSIAPGALANVIFVDGDAPGANDGSSWQNAYNYLEDALADANSSAKPVEIRVGEGVHRPDENALNPDGTGDREATFRLISGVALRGGYAGAGQPDPNERNIGAYETVLSGDLAGNDVDVNDLEVLWADESHAGHSDNAYHVVTGSGTNETAVLGGFSITAGFAVDVPSDDPHSLDPNNRGAGIYNHSGRPTIYECTFRGNIGGHGGGMYNLLSNPSVVKCTLADNWSVGGMGRDRGGAGILNNQSSPTVQDCVFISNRVWYGSGGGMFNYNNSAARLTGCTFINNSAGIGGGMHNSDSDATLEHCTFRGNRASDGGAISCDHGNLMITGCTVRQNAATGRYGSGGGIFTGCGTKLTISSSIISANKAPQGGGVSSGLCVGGWPGSMSISGCIISGNMARMPGAGAIISGVAAPEITNCVITGNGVTNGGGFWNSYQASLTNYNLAGNRGEEDGGGIYSTTPSDGSLTNCIVWSNSPGEIYISSGTPVLSFCDVQGGSPGEGNIDADPCFVNPGYWDPNGTGEDANDDFWVDGDYHLKSQAGRWDPNSGTWVIDDVTSPCIDAGDPMSPVGHEPFPNGGIINMGAYGGTAEASKSYFGEPPCETIVAGDINGDCRIDFADVAIMTRHWLEDGFPAVLCCVVQAAMDHCIEIDRAFFTSGQDVRIELRLENLLVDYRDRVFFSDGPMVDITVEAVEAGSLREVWRWNWDESYAGPHRLQLGYGQSVGFTCVWPQVDFNGTPDGTDDTKASPGTYRVSAEFSPTQAKVGLDVSIIP